MLPLMLTTTAKNSSTNNSSTNNSSTRQCIRRSTKVVLFSVVLRSTLVSFLSGCYITLKGLQLFTSSLL